MSWTSPRTWTSGELVTAALLNTHLRDNLDFLNTAQSARVYSSAAQSINNNAQTAATWDSEAFDTDGFHVTSGATARITIPSGLGGLYLVIGETQWASNGTGWRRAHLIHTGSGTNFATVSAPGATASNLRQSVSGLYYAVAGDYFTMEVFQDSGAALNLNTSSWFGAARIGA